MFWIFGPEGYFSRRECELRNSFFPGQTEHCKLYKYSWSFLHFHSYIPSAKKIHQICVWAALLRFVCHKKQPLSILCIEECGWEGWLNRHQKVATSCFASETRGVLRRLYWFPIRRKMQFYNLVLLCLATSPVSFVVCWKWGKCWNPWENPINVCLQAGGRIWVIFLLLKDCCFSKS